MKFFNALMLLTSLSLSFASDLDITKPIVGYAPVNNAVSQINHNEAPLEPIPIPAEDSPIYAPPTAQQIVETNPANEIDDAVPGAVSEIETKDASNVSDVETNDAANESENETPVDSETPGQTPTDSETPGQTPTDSETPGNPPTDNETQSTVQVDETPGNPPAVDETQSTVQVDETPGNPPAADETAGNESDYEDPVEVQDNGEASDDYGDSAAVDKFDGANDSETEIPQVTDEVPKPEDKSKAEEEKKETEEEDQSKDKKIAAALGGAAALASAGIFFYIRKSKRNGLESVRTQISMV